MKPDHQVESVKWLSRYDDPNRRGSFPRIAFEYQARRENSSFGSDHPVRRPGFSLLAREVLGANARRTLGRETALFGFVTLVSAWPLAVMIREVIRLLK